jgi:hypothetical protein
VGSMAKGLGPASTKRERASTASHPPGTTEDTFAPLQDHLGSSTSAGTLALIGPGTTGHGSTIIVTCLQQVPRIDLTRRHSRRTAATACMIAVRSTRVSIRCFGGLVRRGSWRGTARCQPLIL